MHIGDHLLYINSVNVRGLGADQVGAILRQQIGHQLRLLVARPVVNAAVAQQTLSSPSNIHTNFTASPPASFSTTAPPVVRRFFSEGASVPDHCPEGPYISPHAPLISTSQLDETARMIAHSPEFYRALLLQQQLIPEAPPLESQDTAENTAAPPNAAAATPASASDPMKASSVCSVVF